MSLTKADLNTKPGAKPIELRDDKPRGLILRIQPSGVRTFYFEHGRGKRVRIGRADILTLEAARDQAKKLAADPNAEITTVRKKASGGSFKDYLDDHYAPWCEAHLKSHADTLRRIRQSFAWLNNSRLNEITGQMVEKWRTEQLKAGMSPKSVNNRIGELSSVLSHAVKNEVLKEHPLRKVEPMKVDNARIRWLKPDEQKRVGVELRKLPADSILRNAIVVSLCTGIRKGELLALVWDDIDFDNKVLTVRAAAAKSGKTRRIALNDDAIAALKARKGGAVPFPIAVGTLHDAWEKFREAAQLVDFHWHDLRHDFASKLVMAGVDLNTVRELMGHSSLAMTLRYAHLAPEHRAAAVSKLKGVI